MAVQVRDVLHAAAISLDPTMVKQIQGCQQPPFHYRNKMTFTASPNGFGLYHNSSSVLVPVQNCHLQDATANKILQRVSLESSNTPQSA